MISITYTICCDSCGHKIDRILSIEHVSVIDADNSEEFFRMLTPVLPRTWIVVKPMKAGEPDSIFCSRDCKNLADEK